VLSLFAVYNLNWPPLVRQLLNAASAFYINIELVSPECTVSFGLETKFWVVQTLPLAAAALCGGLNVAEWARKKWVLGRDEEEGRLWGHSHRLTGTYILAVQVTYIWVASTALDVLDCSVREDGKSYLDRWPEQECGSGVQRTLAPYAWFFLVIYGVGVPATCVGLIWGKRDLVRSDQERRRRGVGWKRGAEREDPVYELRKRYHKIYVRDDVRPRIRETLPTHSLLLHTTVPVRARVLLVVRGDVRAQAGARRRLDAVQRAPARAGGDGAARAVHHVHLVRAVPAVPAQRRAHPQGCAARDSGRARRVEHAPAE